MSVLRSAAKAHSKHEVQNVQTFGPIGFDAISQQLINKTMKNGFTFNVMVIGETGVGKSTLMDTLFDTSFESKPKEWTHSHPNVRISLNKYELNEEGLKLKLSIVDVVGFGDQLNRVGHSKILSSYIDDQYEAYLQEELKIIRTISDYQDTRPHVCLYLIRPSGHSLSALDLDCLKELSVKCNVVPVIARADCLTNSELEKFKSNILKDLKREEVIIYQLPTDDKNTTALNTQLNAEMPFAVVCSKKTVYDHELGRNVRVRQYPWGTVTVENEDHSDLLKLRELLIRVNMVDMREKTSVFFYENYRRKRLEEMGFFNSAPPPSTVNRAYYQSDVSSERVGEATSSILPAERIIEPKLLAAAAVPISAQESYANPTAACVKEEVAETEKKDHNATLAT